MAANEYQDNILRSFAYRKMILDEYPGDSILESKSIDELASFEIEICKHLSRFSGKRRVLLGMISKALDRLAETVDESDIL